jgi:F-type H+-transporting ATPase subunit epsilon
MPSTFELEIATPERRLVKESVSEAQIPGKKGYFGILPEHAPMVAELGDGALSYQIGGRKHYVAIHGGWLEVLGERVSVLADRAELGGEIDVPRAQRALDRAKERLINPAVGIDIARALSAMLRAESRLQAAQQEGK